MPPKNTATGKKIKAASKPRDNETPVQPGANASTNRKSPPSVNPAKLPATTSPKIKRECCSPEYNGATGERSGNDSGQSTRLSHDHGKGSGEEEVKATSPSSKTESESNQSASTGSGNGRGSDAGKTKPSSVDKENTDSSSVHVKKENRKSMNADASPYVPGKASSNASRFSYSKLPNVGGVNNDDSDDRNKNPTTDNNQLDVQVTDNEKTNQEETDKSFAHPDDQDQLTPVSDLDSEVEDKSKDDDEKDISTLLMEYSEDEAEDDEEHRDDGNKLKSELEDISSLPGSHHEPGHEHDDKEEFHENEEEEEEDENVEKEPDVEQQGNESNNNDDESVEPSNDDDDDDDDGDFKDTKSELESDLSNSDNDNASVSSVEENDNNSNADDDKKSNSSIDIDGSSILIAPFAFQSRLIGILNSNSYMPTYIPSSYPTRPIVDINNNNSNSNNNNNNSNNTVYTTNNRISVNATAGSSSLTLAGLTSLPKSTHLGFTPFTFSNSTTGRAQVPSVSTASATNSSIAAQPPTKGTAPAGCFEPSMVISQTSTQTPTTTQAPVSILKKTDTSLDTATTNGSTNTVQVGSAPTDSLTDSVVEKEQSKGWCGSCTRFKCDYFKKSSTPPSATKNKENQELEYTKISYDKKAFNQV